MYTIRERMKRLRQIEETLPEFLYVVSVEDKSRGIMGGRMTHVSRGIAAGLLDAGSHRIATDDEVTAHEAQEEEKRLKARLAATPMLIRHNGPTITLEPKKKQGR